MSTPPLVALRKSVLFVRPTAPPIPFCIAPQGSSSRSKSLDHRAVDATVNHPIRLMMVLVDLEPSVTVVSGRIRQLDAGVADVCGSIFKRIVHQLPHPTCNTSTGPRSSFTYSQTLTPKPSKNAALVTTSIFSSPERSATVPIE